MNKQELATKIWATANELRKNIKASEYKDYILGFMFYKYLCDKEVDYLKDLGGEIDDLQDVDEDTKDKFKDGIGYFISYKNLFHEMFSLYVATRKCEVDVLRLDRLEATANKEKLKAYYNVPIFKAHVKLHQDLKEYIEGRKADNLEGVD